MNEVKHFTKSPEIQHFAEVKVSPTDNAYGVTWAEVVRNYLKGAYTSDEAQAEAKAFGKTYKVLRRTDVTVFYDEAGNTLFDVTNERLADEYDWITSNPVDEAEESKDNLPDEEDADVANEDSDNSEEETPVEENVEPANEVNGEEEEKAQNSSVYIGVVGAVTKLQEELKKAKEKDFAEPVIEYLIERCKESESLAADICQDHKTWEKCYQYIYESARKKLSGKSGPVRSDVVFEWAEDYYHKDDKAEEEKKAKEAAEKKKKEKERKEKAATSKENKARADYDTTRKSPTDNHKLSEEKIAAMDRKETPKPKSKKNSKDMDGQMDLFSLMGM